jgi:hypothetical protein
MSKQRVDRLKVSVNNEKTGKPELTIDIPTHFKVDTNSLYNAVMKEMIKQEKNSK